jgi:acetyl esterase/lipase
MSVNMAPRNILLLLSRPFLYLALAVAVVACSPVRMLNALVPEDGLKSSKDIAYGPGERGRLDVYAPVSPTPRPRPVIVFYYGGGWDSGRRGDYLFVAEALASRGFITVIPDYRLYPEVVYPAFLEDGAAALRWTFDHIEQFGGDARNVFVLGHSAGAQIAMMLAFDRTWLAHVQRDPAQIRGVIGLAGPYDFLPLTSARLKAIFPSAESQALSQPIRYARKGAPAALLVTGENDAVVGAGNSRRFALRIRESGGEVKEKYYPDLGHAKLVAVLAAPLRGNYPVLDDIDAFVNASLGP